MPTSAVKVKVVEPEDPTKFFERNVVSAVQGDDLWTVTLSCHHSMGLLHFDLHRKVLNCSVCITDFVEETRKQTGRHAPWSPTKYASANK